MWLRRPINAAMPQPQPSAQHVLPTYKRHCPVAIQWAYATVDKIAADAAWRFRNCASSASSAQNSEQK
jgi:hypothetical protein